MSELDHAMDPFVARLPSGKFKVWFRDMRRATRGSTASATSGDAMKSWVRDPAPAARGPPHESPAAFRWQVRPHAARASSRWLSFLWLKWSSGVRGVPHITIYKWLPLRHGARLGLGARPTCIFFLAPIAGPNLALELYKLAQRGASLGGLPLGVSCRFSLWLSAGPLGPLVAVPRGPFDRRMHRTRGGGGC